MEVSLAFQRCVRRVPSSSLGCRYNTSVKLGSRTPRQQIVQTCYRTLTTSPTARQDTIPQSQAAIQSQASRKDTVAPQTDSSLPATARPDDRINVSSILGNTLSSTTTTTTPSSSPSSRLTRRSDLSARNPNSAAAKLEQLFAPKNPDDNNPFERTLRQTGASKSPTSSSDKFSPLDISKFLSDLPRPASAQVEEQRMPLRLRPTLGRTQTVDTQRGMDLARAFRTLEVKCSVNGVKRDVRNQRFHVRRGQARKLLRSQRWRTAFKAGFIEECARVRRMKNQGW